MHFFLIPLAVLHLLAPPAHAQGYTVDPSYLTPDQVLDLNKNAFYLPGNKREARKQADEQAQQNIKNHPSVLSGPGTDKPAAPATPPASSTTETPAQPADASGLHEAAPDASADGALDPITARFLRRLEQQQSTHLFDPQTDTIGSTAALHSAAPLAGSGPAENVTVAIMLGAVGWTVWRAKKMKQFMQW